MSTILVIDDLEANRNVLVTLLRYKGHRLLEAANGREALALVYSEAPDLVITDVLMPVMDGFEFVRQLKLEPFTSAIPVIFYTAHYGEREARSLAHSSGVVHVLTKPTEPEEVLEVVGRILNDAGAQRPVVPVPQLSPDFDREHLRLVTDKLSEKAEDLNRANARLRALIDIGLELASERDNDRLLANVCRAARKLFGATYVTLGVHDRNDVVIRKVVACGTAANWIDPGSAAPGLLRDVVQKRKPHRGANIDGDPASLGLPAEHPPIVAFLAAPVVSPAHVYGWICLVSNDGHAFTDDEEGLLIALAGQVGRIYENGYFYALAQSERDRAQRYLDTAEVMLLALDTAGRVVQVNRYACDVLGWSAAELTGRSWVDSCVPDDGQRELRARLSQLVNGDLGMLEYSVRTRAGEVRQIEWHNTLLRDESGRLVGTLSSGTDITERKRADEETNRQARLLALSATIGLAMTGADSIENALEQCAQALVRHLGADVARIWMPNEHNGALELQASAGCDDEGTPSAGAVVASETVIRRIANERRPFLTNAIQGDRAIADEWMQREGLVAFVGHPLIVENNVVAVIALYARSALPDDILSVLASAADQVALGIARYQSALRVQRAEARTQFALQSANVGIWDIDYVTGELRWSRVIEKQYGFQPDMFPGTFDAFLARVHPDDREKLMETVSKAKATGSEFTTEHRAQWPDGTVRWVSGAGRMQRDESGNPVRAIGISMDITERRSLEQQYQQAQKMEAVGRLAGGVAHDFNNLLNAIIGYCELLLGDFDPRDPRRADLDEIHSAALSAASLTHQLLAFSRKQIIEPTVLDLNAVMNDIRRMLGRLIGEDVTVVLSLHPDLARVKADRGQVEQIVLNLAVNARDAMPSGGTLTIETTNVQLDDEYARANLSFAAGTYVVLTVTDTGTGMTPEVQARLFEPFFTTKEVGKGTGLGLATVHGIVTRAGGAVHVYSEPGLGSAFKVYFPTAENHVVDAPVASTAPERRHSAGAHVLVVEDAEGIRKLARRILERAGYQVHTAADAAEAGELFDAQPIDVLLTDVVMPGMSGPELASELAGRRAGLKVLYMSGYTEETIVHHGIVQTGVAFLHKPFNADALTRKVREVLDS